MALCSMPACNKSVVARGFCNPHYRRFLAHGDPLAGPTVKGEVPRFLNDVVFPYKGDDCLIWPYGRGSHGYAVISVGGDMRTVHSLVCEAINGPAIPPMDQAAHSCGNGRRGCVSPMHLSWKTRMKNEADKIEHGSSNRGERNGRSSLTLEQVREIRKLKNSGLLQREVGEMFGIRQGTVSAIYRGASWGWLP